MQSIMLELKNYCKKYDVSIKYIIDVISDLKVIPMIRGKSFEYTVSDKLEQVLSSGWQASHLNMNAQPGNHDVDVLITRKEDGKKIRIECKLTKNDSFKLNGSVAEIRVKCMRSRTFSDNSAATRMAQSYGVRRDSLLMHADSYREKDFDFVITSLGNSFWTTKDSKYVFNGNRMQFDYLKNLFPEYFKNYKNFQKEAFNFLLIARSSDLIVSPKNNLICTRKKCKNSGTNNDCGFIPNYPIVNLNQVAEGHSSWKTLNNIEREFTDFLK